MKVDIDSLTLIDSGSNLSYHKPLSLILSLPIVFRATVVNNQPIQRCNMRWDKCNLNNYYNASRDCLAAVNINTCDCGAKPCVCALSLQQSSVDVLYNEILMALTVADRGSVPRIPLRSLKPFWTAEFDEFKQKIYDMAYLIYIIFGSLMVVLSVTLFITLSQAQSFNIKRQLKMPS